MNRLLLVLMLATAIGRAGEPVWEKDLSTPAPGNFPLPRPEKAVYRFGWFTFSAGRAEAVFSKTKHDTVQLEATGGTTGFVRDIWKLDATHKAVATASTLCPLRVKQVEKYSSRTVTTSVVFNEEGVTSLRSLDPPDPIPSGRQKFRFSNVRDLLTALLYIRSQPLRPGDKVNVVVYPANAPYLTTVQVLDREKIHVKAGTFKALKVEVHLQKINGQLGLEPHRKLKRAVAWVSDDNDRILLRVEAEIFVGSVWAELQNVEFTGS